MRHVIRDCHRSYHSRMNRRVVHKDREAERMVKRGHLLSRVSKKTGRSIDWLQFVKELCDDEKQRDMLLGLEKTIEIKMGEAEIRHQVNSLSGNNESGDYYAGKADGLNDAQKEIDKILNPRMY